MLESSDKNFQFAKPRQFAQQLYAFGSRGNYAYDELQPTLVLRSW